MIKGGRITYAPPGYPTASRTVTPEEYQDAQIVIIATGVVNIQVGNLELIGKGVADGVLQSQVFRIIDTKQDVYYNVGSGQRVSVVFLAVE